MILLVVAAGLIAGSGLTWAADYLPCFSSLESEKGAQLRPKVELATWIILKSIVRREGRSRIHVLNSAVELFSALLGVYLWRRFGLSWNLVWFAGLASFFILIALVDLRYRLVLNALVFPAAALALVLGFTSSMSTAVSALLGGGLGLGMFALVAWLRPGELGAGDIKLAALIGLLFGFPYALWALLIGAGSGGVGAVVLLVSRRGNLSTQIPYAPFLCLGALLALLYNPVPPGIQPIVWQVLAGR